MSIPDSPKKINIIAFIAIVVVLVFFLVFGGLKLSHFSTQKQPIRVVFATAANVMPDEVNRGEGAKYSVSGGISGAGIGVASGQVVASKTGTKFHLPDCPGAKQISAKNLVVFEGVAAAIKAGLSPASNCKGLQGPQTQ